MSNANRETGEIAIKLDRDRILKFNFAALKGLEAETDVSLISGPLFTQKLRSFAGLIMALYHGLLFDDPDITRERIAEIIEDAPPKETLAKVEYCFEKVTKAIDATMSDDAKKKANEMLAAMKENELGVGQISNALPMDHLN